MAQPAPNPQRAADAESPRWQSAKIKHEYRVGRFLLVRKRFAVDWRAFSLAELGDDTPVPPVPSAPLRGDQDGFLIYSHPLPEGLPRLQWLPGMIRYVPRRFERYFIDLEMSFADYRAGLSSSTRASLVRQVRKFAKASGGNIDWREYRTPEEIAEFHILARPVSAVTYQERMDSGLPASAEELEEMRSEATAGRLRAYLLFLDGEPIAYLYCPFERGVLVYGFMGYCPEHRKLSPGSVLLWLFLERSFADASCRYFDFAGAERTGTEQKRRLATGRMVCGHIWFLRRSIKNSALVLFLSAFDFAYLAAVKLVARAGLLRRMKKLIRRA